MRRAGGDQVREAPARRRRRLEPAVAPAAVEEEPLDRGPVDDRRAVHGHVHDPAPGAQHPRLADHRHQRHARLHHVLDHRQVPPRGVGVVEVEVAAEHQPALVRLADVEMPHPEGHHARDHRLQPLGHEGLQHMAFDRQPQPRHRADLARPPRDRHPDLVRSDIAPRGLHPAHPAALDAKPGHLAVLDQIDAARVRGPRKAPGHRVVPRRPGPPLQKPAVDRKARVVEVEVRRVGPHLLAGQQLRVVALQPHGVAAPREGVELAVGVAEVEHAALRHHHVVVQLPLQPLPELQRMRIELRVALQQVVRPHDRGVAPDIAAAELSPAPAPRRSDAVVLGEVVGGRKPVPAAADDDDVVGGLWRRVAPDRRPVPVAGQRVRRIAQAE